MTTQELIEEVWEHTGEASDLSPYTAGVFDIASDGAVKLLRWINKSYKKITNWKFPNGELLWLSPRYEEEYFQTIVKTGTAQAGSSSGITLDASESATANRFKGWVVKITGGTGSGQVRAIVAYAATRVATVAYAWTTTPDATSTYALYKRFYRFVRSADPLVADNIAISPVTKYRSVTRIMNMQTKAYLLMGSRLSTFRQNNESISDPSAFVVKKNTIWFDAVPDEAKYYLIEYVGSPDDLSDASDEPDIPEEFHDCIALLTIWWSLRRDQNWSAAYATKRDLMDLISSLRQPEELLLEGEEDFLEIGYGGF